MRSNQREQPQQQWQQEKPGSTMTATACIWDPHGCEWREREESGTACDSTQTRAEEFTHRTEFLLCLAHCIRAAGSCNSSSGGGALVSQFTVCSPSRHFLFSQHSVCLCATHRTKLHVESYPEIGSLCFPKLSCTATEQKNCHLISLCCLT